MARAKFAPSTVIANQALNFALSFLGLQNQYNDYCNEGSYNYREIAYWYESRDKEDSDESDKHKYIGSAAIYVRKIRGKWVATSIHIKHSTREALVKIRWDQDFSFINEIVEVPIRYEYGEFVNFWGKWGEQVFVYIEE